jgi:hypothetical protein
MTLFQVLVQPSKEVSNEAQLFKDNGDCGLIVYELQVSFNAEHAMQDGTVSGAFSAACYDVMDESDQEEDDALVTATPQNSGDEEEAALGGQSPENPSVSPEKSAANEEDEVSNEQGFPFR